MSKYDKYEMTIGIECHVQLATSTKLFSSADNDSRFAEPNSNVNAIDYGLPGMLPVLNRHAVDLAIKAGKALGSKIALVSNFDRHHDDRAMGTVVHVHPAWSRPRTGFHSTPWCGWRDSHHPPSRAPVATGD